MAANTSPIFLLTPNLGAGQVSAANTARDGTGTVVTIFTAGTNGSLITYFRVEATVTTTAGMVRLFTYDGANTRLLVELPVTAVTPSASVPAFAFEWVPTRPIALLSGWLIKASTHNAEAMNVFAFGGDY